MESNLPVAGASMENWSEANNSDEISHKWCSCPSEIFHLRSGDNYSSTGKKSPSPESILELVGVEIDNFGSRVQIPPEWTQFDVPHPSIPHIFIVNLQIPEDFSTSFFTEITDGPGWSLVYYFRLTDPSSQVLGECNTSFDALTLDSGTDDNDDASGGEKSIPAPNIAAIHLFHRFCREVGDYCSDSDRMKGRFKTIMHCRNIDEFKLPSFITQYNAKPVLIKQTGTVVRGEKYIEMDINVHRFGSVPKKALQTLIGNFDHMIIDMGFCIESREDDEMPETIFGCATLIRPVYGRSPTL